MKGLFGRHIAVTQKVLDLRLERQNVVMANIANVNTLGTSARKLELKKTRRRPCTWTSAAR